MVIFIQYPLSWQMRKVLQMELVEIIEGRNVCIFSLQVSFIIASFFFCKPVVIKDSFHFIIYSNTFLISLVPNIANSI